MELDAISMIWRRELIRLARDRTQIAGSLARPVLWLLILGVGMGASVPDLGKGRYVEYLFPGIVGLNLLFASFLSAISIIWDREFGFLKEMLVAPISRTTIALGKAASGATVACLQGCLVMAFIPLVGLTVSPWRLLAALPVMLLTALTMTSLGLTIAFRMTSFEGFGTVANFILMPMFFLSGAIFPLDQAPRWITLLSRVNPMTYAVDGLRGIFLGSHILPLAYDLVMLAAFGGLAVSLAIWAFRRRV